MRQAIISIEGMSCEHCVIQVQKALGMLKGIEDADVTIGTATVHYDEELVKREDMEAAIEAAGYEVREVTL